MEGRHSLTIVALAISSIGCDATGTSVDNRGDAIDGGAGSGDSGTSGTAGEGGEAGGMAGAGGTGTGGTGAGGAAGAGEEFVPEPPGSSGALGFTYDPSLVRYVTTSGSDLENGMTEATAWRSLSAAAQRAQPGWTIFVKAGTYGSEQVVFSTSGTPAQPIRLVGYRSTPGDHPAVRSWAYPYTTNSAEIPVLDFGTRTAGMAIRLDEKSHVEVRNLQIENYLIGVYGDGSTHCLVENVSVTETGDPEQEYSGAGIKFTGGASDNAVVNCVVGNSTSENLMIIGDRNKVLGCISYCNDAASVAASTDYYLMTGGSHNIIAHNVAHRIGDVPHLGHGIGSKTRGPGHPSEHNLFQSNTAIGFKSSSFYVRHKDSRHNTFRFNTARDGLGAGFMVHDAAHHNLVEHHTTINQGRLFIFLDSGEDGAYSNSGEDNIFRDIVAKNVYDVVFVLSDYLNPNAVASRNVFERITVDGGSVLFRVESMGADNVLKDSAISNVSTFAQYGEGRSAGDIGFAYENVTWSANGFADP